MRGKKNSEERKRKKKERKGKKNLEIGMNNVTTMQIGHANRHLLRDDAHERDREAAIAIHSNQCEEIAAELFEDHGNIFVVREEERWKKGKE